MDGVQATTLNPPHEQLHWGLRTGHQECTAIRRHEGESAAESSGDLLVGVSCRAAHTVMLPGMFPQELQEDLLGGSTPLAAAGCIVQAVPAVGRDSASGL